MAVTELAVLRCAAGSLTEGVRDMLKAAQSVQDTWCAQHFPTSQLGIANRGTWVFQQIEDPSVVLLCAKWDSVPAHWEWIKSDENQGIMTGLAAHIVPGGDSGADLLHLDADIFDASDLLSCPVLSVGRISISAANKTAFEQKFNEVRGILEDFADPFPVRAGWRIDKEAENAEEFVLLCGWDSVGQHMDFSKTEQFAKYKEISAFINRANLKHYRRILQ